MRCCELCKGRARIYCESDQASLCWSCDARVHSANFLVAKHSRNLLCHSCQSPTPWSAAGEKLGRTASLCVVCVDGCDRGVLEKREMTDESITDNSSSNDDDDDDSDDEEEDDVENQVVPWSSSSPPPASSSSSQTQQHEFSDYTDTLDVSSKPSPQNNVDADLPLKVDDFNCSSTTCIQKKMATERVADCGGDDPFVVDPLCLRPLKMRKIF